MKEIKKSASFKSKQKGKDVKFTIDLNYSPEYDSFIIRVKQGEGFMAYSSNIERMPLEVIQKLNEMLEEVLIQAGSKTEIKEHKMSNGGGLQDEFYIKYLNKEKNFKEDIKYFKSYDEARKWGRENLENFNSDMISFKLENGGDFQSGVYAMGGSLQAHGIEVGDTFVRTISGGIQKVKDKNGKIVYINLSTGERDSQPPLPFKNGGGVGIEEDIDMTDDYVLRVRKPAMPTKKLTEQEWAEKHNAGAYEYMGNTKMMAGGKVGSVKVGDFLKKKGSNLEVKVIEVGNDWRSGYDTITIYNDVTNDTTTLVDWSDYEKSKYVTGGDLITETADSIFYANAKNGKIKTSFGDKTKEGLLNMLTNVNYDRNEIVDAIFDANEKNGKINTGFGTKTKEGLSQMIKNMQNTFATGGGVGLIGNQNRIDMNKNGKIDAEDFKLLRSSMNGAWRNERKHVNHNEDYEVRYARKKPARTGYKGKRKFGDGGGISNFERLSRVVAKNYEGKRVKPQYQKEYGKVYSKSEAKEVGNKVAGKVKANQKMNTGGETKKGAKGGIMVLAKKIRKEGESWQDALKRAGQQLK